MFGWISVPGVRGPEPKGEIPAHTSFLRRLFIALTVLALLVAGGLDYSGSYHYQHLALHYLRFVRSWLFHVPGRLWRAAITFPLLTTIIVLSVALLTQRAIHGATPARRKEMLDFLRSADSRLRKAYCSLKATVTTFSLQGVGVFLVLASLGLILILIASDWYHDPVVIDPIVVPNTYEELIKTGQGKTKTDAETTKTVTKTDEEFKGYTSQILTNRIYDELKEIERNARWYAEAHARRDSLTVANNTNLPDIEIPEIKLSYRATVGFLEEFLGVQPRRVSGEILIVPDPVPSASSSPSQKPAPPGQHLMITLRVTRTGKDEDLPLRVTDVSPDDPEAAIRQAAEAIFHLINPHVLAVYAYDDYKKAIDDYSMAISLDQNDQQAYYNRGVAYYLRSGTGDCDLAIKDYDEAIKLDFKFAAAYYSRGMAYADKSDYDRAIREYTQAIRFDPEGADAYDDRGNAYSEKRDYDLAIADYTKAIHLDPKFSYAYVNRGLAYEYKGDHSRAIEDYTDAVRLDPEDAYAHNDRALTHVSRDDYDRAIADYNKAVRLDPRCAWAYVNRGIAYENKGEHDRATADYDQAISIDDNSIGWDKNNRVIYDSDNTVVFNSRGFAYYQKHDYDRAIWDYSEAMSITPNYPDAYDNRGLAYLNTGDYDRAIADDTEAIHIIPKDADAYRGLGDAYYCKGDYKRAIMAHSVALHLNPNDADAYSDRGDDYFQRGEDDRAIADYDKAITINPKFAVAISGRGNAYYNKGDVNRAMADYETAAGLYTENVVARPSDPEALDGAASMLAACPENKLRDGGRALRYAKKACQLTSWKNPFYLNTLAAAYAESGNFKQAVTVEDEALSAITGGNPEFRKRLELYQHIRPYRSNMI